MYLLLSEDTAIRICYNPNMENFNNPYIDKLVGLSVEQKELEKTWHEYIINTIETIGGQKIENFEIEKREIDIDLILFTESALNKIFEQYGRKKNISIPLNNIHVLKFGGTEAYTKGRLSRGAHSSIQQSIIVDRDISDIQFSLELFHELMHVKSYTAFQILPGRETYDQRIEKYRAGMRVVSRDAKKVYLQSIEEAMIGYLTNNFYESIIKNDPRFKGELDKINNGEIIVDISRQEEQVLLNQLIDSLYEKNKAIFTSREEVLSLFIDAQINGRLLKLGRLIEQTFGAGTLKKMSYQNIS